MATFACSSITLKDDVASVHYKDGTLHGVPTESTPIPGTLYLISL